MKIKEFFKEEKNKRVFAKCIIAFLFPFALCVMYCWIRNISFGDIYVPASKNNDSLYYFKLVEAVRHGLFPKGYFGFNESHAGVLSFAAWSPVLLIPWIIASLIFGWGYTTSVIINILLFSIGFALFVFFANPKIDKLAKMMIIFLLFPSIFIHLMCILPEAHIAGTVLVFTGIAFRLSREADDGKKSRNILFILLIAIGLYLTLIRPYMVVLSAIPIVLSIKEKKKGLIIASILTTVLSLAGYFAVSKFFTAEYFTPLFDLGIVKLFITGKFTEGFWSSVYVIRDMRKAIFDQVKDAFSFGLTSGTHYVMLLLLFVSVLIQIFFKKNKKARVIAITYLAAVAGVFSAIVLLLQKANEGGRHIWVFVVMGIAVITLFEECNTSNILKCIIALVLVVFIVRGSVIPTDYDAPADNGKTHKTVEYWKDVFKEKDIKHTKNLGYENTVDWVFVDYIDGVQVVTEHNGLYALPKGFGISCCSPDYILDNFDNLQSKYIFTYKDALVAKKCEEYNYRIVGEHGNSIMYERY